VVISAESLRGYLLEEILADLIRHAGYRLLVDPAQGPELDRRPNGLVVIGRGGVHQADVLGQLLWIPAFTFPLRLFVEAKHRAGRTDIAAVRNAIGLLEDLNQNYTATPGSAGPPLQRFLYRYALFSTSGFSPAASKLALAHQISLIDLGGPDFHDLRALVDETTTIAHDLLTQAERITPEPVSQRASSAALRRHLRLVLETWPDDVPMPESPTLRHLDQAGAGATIHHLDRTLQAGLARLGEFFLGMANGPFLLVLRPNNPRQFLDYAREDNPHRVRISWRQSRRGGTQWTIRPLHDPGAYSLAFGLPHALEEWIFADEQKATRRALAVKGSLLSDITIYRHDGERDELYRLVYDATAVREQFRHPD
jgi:hypothetical protein